MTGQSGNGTESGPVGFCRLPGGGQAWLDTRGCYDELTAQDLSACAGATVVAGGEYGPARHGTGDRQPLRVAGHLEVLASGEVVARVYRRVQVGRALHAGATWAQVAGACSCGGARARRKYRDWAEGQHKLLTGGLGKEPGGFGMSAASYAAALAGAAVGRLEPGPAGAYGFGRSQARALRPGGGQ